MNTNEKKGCYEQPKMQVFDVKVEGHVLTASPGTEGGKTEDGEEGEF